MRVGVGNIDTVYSFLLFCPSLLLSLSCFPFVFLDRRYLFTVIDLVARTFCLTAVQSIKRQVASLVQLDAPQLRRPLAHEGLVDRLLVLVDRDAHVDRNLHPAPALAARPSSVSPALLARAAQWPALAREGREADREVAASVRRVRLATHRVQLARDGRAEPLDRRLGRGGGRRRGAPLLVLVTMLGAALVAGSGLPGAEDEQDGAGETENGKGVEREEDDYLSALRGRDERTRGGQGEDGGDGEEGA